MNTFNMYLDKMPVSRYRSVSRSCVVANAPASHLDMLWKGLRISICFADVPWAGAVVFVTKFLSLLT